MSVVQCGRRGPCLAVLRVRRGKPARLRHAPFMTGTPVIGRSRGQRCQDEPEAALASYEFLFLKA